MSKRPFITITTDFGLSDGYDAAMKGVIYSICPDAVVVDISHQINKFDIMHGALVIASTASDFPKGTVHVGVIDPGVGTSRRGIAIKTKNYVFVGPDNGLFSLAAELDGIEAIYELKNKKYFRPIISSTFHGRDIFAPVAAHIACGVPVEEVGPRIKDYIKKSFSEPKVSDNLIEGIILHIDSFGNISTNIHKKYIEEFGLKFGDWVKCVIGGKEYKIPFVETFGKVKVGELHALIGSSNFFDLAINQGNAAEFLKVKQGAPVKIEKL